MEFKVKEINKEEKSRVEVEVDLLKKHEEKFEEQEGDTSVGKIDLSDKKRQTRSYRKMYLRI